MSPRRSVSISQDKSVSQYHTRAVLTSHTKHALRISKEVPKKICNHKEEKKAEEVTENARNVSLASILGLININERKGVIDIAEVKDISNKNNEAGLIIDQDTKDRFIFL